MTMKKPKRAIPQEITALALCQHLGEILDQVTHKRKRFLIKRSGVPAAILLSLADYEDLEDCVDTWYEQQDETFQQSLLKAHQEIVTGKVATLDDLQPVLSDQNVPALSNVLVYKLFKDNFIHESDTTVLLQPI
jgi:PHD/YefM family antitoxin component YafN of YafNO toxin-antitoxin module